VPALPVLLLLALLLASPVRPGDDDDDVNDDLDDDSYVVVDGGRNGDNITAATGNKINSNNSEEEEIAALTGRTIAASVIHKAVVRMTGGSRNGTVEIRLRRLAEAESFVPELTEIVGRAYDTVFVIAEEAATSTANVVVDNNYEEASSDSSERQKQRILQQHQRRTRHRFFEAVASLLGRRGERYVVDAVYDCAARRSKSSAAAANDEEDDGDATVGSLADLLYRLAAAATATDDTANDDCSTLPRVVNNDDVKSRRSSWGEDALAVMAKNNKTSISRSGWKEWLANARSPVHLALSTVLYRVLFFDDCNNKNKDDDNNSSSSSVSLRNTTSRRQQQLLFRLPEPAEDEDSKSSFAAASFTSRELLALAAMGLGSGGMKCHSLFDSDRHGLSFRTFQEALLSYGGPTLILIRTAAAANNNNNSGGKSTTLGYVTHGTWKQSSKWYAHEDNKTANLPSHFRNSVGLLDAGDDDFSFLFRLSPRWAIYPMIQSESKPKYHQYLNLPVETSFTQPRHKPVLRGLAVGGVDADSPRLHLTESLEQCRATSFDLTFEQGPLLGGDDDNIFFDVESLQIWAVQTSDEVYLRYLQIGQQNKSVRDGARLRAAHVDKKQFVEDFASGAYESNLYHHREQARGRADFAVLDDSRQGYYLEGKHPSTGALDHQHCHHDTTATKDDDEDDRGR